MLGGTECLNVCVNYVLASKSWEALLIFSFPRAKCGSEWWIEPKILRVPLIFGKFLYEKFWKTPQNTFFYTFPTKTRLKNFFKQIFQWAHIFGGLEKNSSPINNESFLNLDISVDLLCAGNASNRVSHCGWWECCSCLPCMPSQVWNQWCPSLRLADRVNHEY